MTFHPYITYSDSSFRAFGQSPPSNFPYVSPFTYLCKRCTFTYEHTYLAVISSSIKNKQTKKPSNRSAPFSVWLLFSFCSYLHCAATSSKTYLSHMVFVRDLISARLSLLTPNYPRHT